MVVLTRYMYQQCMLTKLGVAFHMTWHVQYYIDNEMCIMLLWEFVTYKDTTT